MAKNTVDVADVAKQIFENINYIKPEEVGIVSHLIQNNNSSDYDHKKLKLPEFLIVKEDLFVNYPLIILNKGCTEPTVWFLRTIYHSYYKSPKETPFVRVSIIPFTSKFV